MKKQEKSIVMLCVMFGVLAIAVGNIEQYQETQEYFSMVGILSIVWAGAFYLTIKQEQPKVIGKKRTEDLEYTSIFKSNSNGK